MKLEEESQKHVVTDSQKTKTTMKSNLTTKARRSNKVAVGMHFLATKHGGSLCKFRK